MNIPDFTATQLLDRLGRGEISSSEVVSAYLGRIRTHDAAISAFLHVAESAAMEQAAEIDRKRRAGAPLGRLAGLPVAIKDNFCVRGWRVSCGSRMLENYISPYDAHVVSRLKAADAVLLGATNLDEFAMGSSTENSAFQTTRNPWSLEHIAGGSSGGSAAAIAARMAPLALGSDTGGSIRQPAALCGIVGVKPSYGRVSRYGLVAFASSLDQAGPMAADVKSAALLLETIAGPDPRDATCTDRPAGAYLAEIEKPAAPLTLGVVREHFTEGLDADVEKAVRDAIQLFRDLGATIKEVSLPHGRYAVAAYYVVATAEASSNLARYTGVHFGRRAEAFEDLIDMYAQTRGQAFGAEVKRRIMLGTYVLSSGYHEAYYLRALKVRRLIREDFDRVFSQCDAVIGPTTPATAFRIGEKTGNPLAMYLTDVYTISANLAGIAALSVPCGLSKAGLPIGLQIQAPPFDEAKLLRIAQMYERAAGLMPLWPTMSGGNSGS